MYYFARFDSNGKVEMIYTTFDLEDPNAEGLTQITREEFLSELGGLADEAEPAPESASSSLEDQLTAVITKAKNTI